MIGVNPGSAGGFSLNPIHEYVHPLDSAYRIDSPPGIGAYHFVVGKGITNFSTALPKTYNTPNPFSTFTKVYLPTATRIPKVRVDVFSAAGQLLRSESIVTTNEVHEQSSIVIHRGSLPEGVCFYVVSTTNSAEVLRGSMLIVN